MGSWRKVGAFLGLVPDDSHEYDADGYEGAGYEGSQYDDAYEAPRERGAYAGGSYARDGGEASGVKAYPEGGYTDRKTSVHASEGSDANRGDSHEALQPVPSVGLVAAQLRFRARHPGRTGHEGRSTP